MVRAFFRHILNNSQVAVRQPIARFVPFSTPVKTPVSHTPKKPPFKALPSVLLLILATFTLLAGVFSYTRGGASAAANNNLNFQGRLLSTSGSAVADGSYNIEFNLYTQQAPGGVSQWTEDYLVSATQGVTVKNGYFSVNLGSVTPFGTSIAWDQPQYLGMTVRGTGSCAFGACTPNDAEMTPRFRLTAVPYAFRAAALMDSTNTNAYTADDLIQKAPTLVQALNSANTAIRLNQTGAGGLLQLQRSGADVFSIGNDGAVLAKNSTNSLSAFEVQDSSSNSYLKINTQGGVGTFGASSGSSQTILQAGTGGVQISSGANVNIGAVDAVGTLLVLDSKSGADPVTANNGSMYYNTTLNKFRCYENGAWVDCIGGSQSTTGTQSFISGLQNVAANATGVAVETLVFTSSTGVSNVAGVTGFTAPANGSFRSCLIKNNANITAGTLGLRWRVNGVSVGSAACLMDSTTNRQSASVLNPGVVTFNAGDTVGLAFDTSAGFLPTGTNDFTVYWSIDYGTWGAGGGSSTPTLQNVYDNSLQAQIITTNNKDIEFQLADTATDSDFNVNIASGSTGQFAVQSNGTDVLTVNSGGNVVASGGLTVGNSASTTAGTIRWTGSDFEGYNGTLWQSLTSGSGGGAGAVTVHKIKPANQSSVNNTFITDADLGFSIGANESFTFRFVAQANVPAAPDIKFAVVGPAGATCNYGLEDIEGAVATANMACGVSTGLVTGNTADDTFEIVGSIRNGATAGTVQLQWSQNTTAGGTPTILYAGSYVDAYQTIGSGSAGQPFVQGGNAFGAVGTLGTSDSNDLSIVTNGQDRIRVLASGNVGIGDSTPAALLTVGTSDAFQVNASGNVQTAGTLSVQGQTTFSGNVVGSGSSTLTTGTTTVTPGVNTTTVVLTAAGSFANNDVIFINNAGQDYYTRIVSGGGTTTLTVSPMVSYDASASVTKYNVQNIGATSTDYTTQANRFFQGYFLGGVVVGAGSTTLSDGELSRTTGDITITPGAGGVVQVAGTLSATTITVTNITGDGSGLTNLNGANIVGASIPDAGLSSNVALLTGNQTFSGLKTFGAGLTVTAGQTFTVNSDAFTDLTGTNLAISGGVLNVINNPVFSTSVTSPSFTGTGAVTVSSGGGNDLTLDSASNVLLLSDATLRRAAAGSTALQLNDTANTTFSITNTDGTAVANLSVEGSVTATGFTGSGAGLTNLDAAQLTGSINDARLSSNVALLTGSQSFSGLKTFGAGLTVTAGQTFTMNGDAFTDLTGSNLSISGGALNVSATPSFTSVTAATFTGSAGVTLSSGGAGDLTLDSASNVLVLSDATLRRAAAGSTALQLNDTANTTFSITNTDGTAVANLSVEGGVTAATFTGNGSGLTNVGDSALSSNVVLLTGSQTLSGLKTFGAGLTVTAGQTFTMNGDAFTDLTGTNLTISGGALTTANAVTFSTSVTTATLTSTAGLTLDSGNNTLTIAANDTTTQRTAAGTYTLDLVDTGTTVYSLTNSNGTGVLNLNLADGGLTTAGTSRLTNGGALQNITGLTIASGGASITGNANFVNDASINGNLLVGDATTDRLTITSQILGANGLVFQGATDNGFATTFSITDPTANNTITVPNASGTILLLGASAIQTDATTNASIGINKTGASGNILTLQKNGTGVFSIGNDGATSVATTSTAALMISNASAALDYFTVDTSGSLVRIGDSTADGTGTLFILDTKNTSGDPTGDEGAQYYNSSYGTFRCYQGVRGWTDCIGTSKPNTRRTTRLDYQGSGTTFAGQGDIAAVVANSTAAIAASTADPSMISHVTSAANNNVTSISGNLNYSSTNTPSMQTYVQLASTATERIWVGVSNQTSATMAAAANPAGNYAAFRYDTSVGGETTWKCITKNNVTQTINNSGITVTTTGIKMEIIMTATDVVFKIDGVIVCDNTSNLPTPGVMMRYTMSLTNLTNSSHSLRIGWIFLDTDF